MIPGRPGYVVLPGSGSMYIRRVRESAKRNDIAGGNKFEKHLYFVDGEAIDALTAALEEVGE